MWCKTTSTTYPNNIVCPISLHYHMMAQRWNIIQCSLWEFDVVLGVIIKLWLIINAALPEQCIHYSGQVTIYFRLSWKASPHMRSLCIHWYCTCRCTIAHTVLWTRHHVLFSVVSVVHSFPKERHKS